MPFDIDCLQCCGAVRCVYELYISLVDFNNTYTYDVYTAFEHQALSGNVATAVAQTVFTGDNRAAVGFTTGTVAVDADRNQKAAREQYFPTDRIKKGVAFKCLKGEASVLAGGARVREAF